MDFPKKITLNIPDEDGEDDFTKVDDPISDDLKAVEENFKTETTRKIRLTLPSEDKEPSKFDSIDQLMGDDLRAVQDLMQEEDDVILPEESKSSIGQLTVTVGQDESPTSDFFEQEVEKLPQVYGSIEGMQEVAEDQVDEDKVVEKEDKPTEEEQTNTQTQELQEEVREISSEMSKDVSEDTIRSSLMPQIEMSITRYSKDVTPGKPKEETRPSRITFLEPVISATQIIDKTEEQPSGRRKSTSSLNEMIEELSNTDVIQEETSQIRESIDESRASGSTVVSSRQSLQSEEKLPKPSIIYEASTRIADSSQDIDELFDFNREDTDILLDDGEQLEEESEPSVVEEEESRLDRSPYYQKYDELTWSIEEKKITNNVNQKLVIMYLRRRKVQHFLKDTEPPLDQTLKYGRKLDAYGELLKINEEQTAALAEESKTLKEKRDQKFVEINKLFTNMQTRETNIGYGLIYAKTGNQIPDKLVERFIKRQAGQTEQVYLMRLKFIKLKEMVQDKLDAIDCLDIIDKDMRLSDFEQLKAENRAYADKIEEKEEELERLRFKSQSTIQILAHLREKTSAFESDLYDLNDVHEKVTNKSRFLREDLANIKAERDSYRQMTRKVIQESGLLSEPDLLKDMEKSMTKLKALESYLASMAKESGEKTRQIRNLRRNIERTKAQLRSRSRKGVHKHSTEETLESTSVSPQVYKHRPTMIMPHIKSKIFDELVVVKPQAKVTTRRRY